MRTTKKLLLPVVTVMTFLFGFENGAFQLALLKVAEQFSLTGAMMGALVSAQFVGTIFLPLIGGPLADRIGKKKVLLAASALFAVGCILSAMATGAVMFMAGVFMVGAMLGVIESQEAAIFVDALGDSAGRALSFIHCTFALGSVLSPLFLEYWIRGGGSWRMGFSLPGIGFAILLLPLFFTDCSGKIQETSAEAPTSLRSLFTVLFIGLVASIFIYLGMENGIAFFLDSLFTKLFPESGFNALSISLFWLSATVSRLIFGVVRMDPRLIIRWGFCASGAMLLTLALSNSAMLSLVCCVGAGFTYGPIWPLLVAEAARSNPTRTGTAASIMSSASGLGAVLSPLLMGWSSVSLGIRGSFGMLAILAFGGFAICLSCVRLHSRSSKQ